jgi:hypothetical protein
MPLPIDTPDTPAPDAENVPESTTHSLPTVNPATGAAAPTGATTSLKSEAPPIVGTSSDISTDKLSSIQQAGLWLAGGVGLVISVVTLVTLIHWWLYSPVMPTLPADAAAGKDVIANYVSAAQSASDQATKMFDLLVSKAFLPVFTTIIGYIFGSKTT